MYSLTLSNLNYYLPSLLIGTGKTLAIAFSAFILGLILGLLLALGHRATLYWIRYPIMTFCILIQGLPEILILFLMYFGSAYLLSTVFNLQIEINVWLAAIMALSLIVSAYAAKIFHMSFLNINPGQKEAALILGLNNRQILLQILLPQALRNALPGLGNLWLIILKDTSLISLIGVNELFSYTQIAIGNTHQPFTFYIAVSGIYLLLTFISEQGFKRINNHV